MVALVPKMIDLLISGNLCIAILSEKPRASQGGDQITPVTLYMLMYLSCTKSP